MSLDSQAPKANGPIRRTIQVGRAEAGDVAYARFRRIPERDSSPVSVMVIDTGERQTPAHSR